jgi:2'-hydroxyisoflavone reductase
MKLLVLGGTGFAGRAVVEEALRRGAQVTVLNRGQQPPVPGVIALRGDRAAPGGLTALADDTWDAVIDTWSAAPYVVRDSARLLAGRTGRYAYVSSRSVYAYPVDTARAEAGAVVAATPDDGADGEPIDYARTKRGAELAAEQAFGDQALLVRCGLILGPHEDIGRLPWWLRRIAAGGDVPAPGPPGLALQYIDVRDLAAWMLDAVAEGRGGAYDLVSPPGFTTMGELLRTCVSVTGSDARLHWIGPEVIAAQNVSPWIELPIWLPPGEDYDALHRADVSKALAAGLVCRPVVQTVQDTWDWLQTAGVIRQRPDRPVVGLPAEAEARLLAAAH